MKAYFGVYSASFVKHRSQSMTNVLYTTKMEVLNKSFNKNIWQTVLNVFPLLKGVTGVNESPDNQYASLQLIDSSGLTETVKELLQIQLERLMPSVADCFWCYFPDTTDNETVHNGFQLFSDAVNALHSNITPYTKTMTRLQSLLDMNGVSKLNYNAKNAFDFLKIVLRATMHSRLDDFNLEIVNTFYKTSFKVFLHVGSEEDISCGGCDNATDNCSCQEIMHTFQEVNKKLLELDLLERITGDCLTNLIHERIETHVKNTCKGSFDTSYIGTLEEWLETVVLGWLRHIYVTDNYTSAQTMKTFDHKLMHSLYEAYTKTRIDQLFNIIIEYPDSQPAIEDLRVCIEKTDLRSELTNKLQKALVTRLLHSGVNTLDVLIAYISAIKALRQLDPTGVLLETVTHPVRYYLRNREDTIKCIINGLLDEGPSELADELVKGDKSTLCDTSFSDEDMEQWREWMPDPIDADSSKPSKSRRTSDVISMLVNVYGSKDLFVKEYTNLLGERLLSSSNNHTEREYRYLELLKLRFGESELHTCEVMLKDIYDSRRINAHIKTSQQEFPISAKILSAPFWPTLKEETLELPEYIKQQLEVYTMEFEKQKGNRTLSWKSHLGSVQLDVELSDRSLQVTTTPTRAAILWNFQNQNEWTIEDLSSTIRVPPMKLRREIAFWQSMGILKEDSPDRYVLVEENTDKGGPTAAFEAPCDYDETESVMASAQDQREEELGVFWSYIVGMLTNLESLPLDRIHQRLKLFATQGSSSVECSQVELHTFLERKVREHKLLFSGGLYRLPKH